MKIGIVTVPYIESESHFKLMVGSYESFKTEQEVYSIAVINAHRNLLDYKEIKKYNNDVEINKENCLAMAWNVGIKACLKNKCDYVYIPNLDVKLESNAIDNLIEVANKQKKYDVFSMCSQKYDLDYDVNVSNTIDCYSSVMFRSSLFKKLKKLDANNEPFKGMFDENIKPAYCEDIDFQYRLDLHGIKHLCAASAKFWHYGSATIKLHSNPQWANNNLTQFNSAMGFLEKKWGGFRGTMTYKTPFNVV